MDFTTKNVSEINAFIRFWLGDITTDTITDETLNYIIQLNIDKDPAYTGCDVIYYSTVDVLKWLERKQESGTIASGEIKRRKEKVGDVEISEEYNLASDTSGIDGWSTILQDLQTNPSIIGCPITDTSVGGSKLGGVLIGGVSQEEYDRVKRDTDVKSGWCMRSPYRKYLDKNKDLIG